MGRLMEKITTAAREAVLDRLGAAYEKFCELEQTLVHEGRYADAEGAHQYGMWVLRAYTAEMDDPEWRR
jgi:hypothetical protein